MTNVGTVATAVNDVDFQSPAVLVGVTVIFTLNPTMVLANPIEISAL